MKKTRNKALITTFCILLFAFCIFLTACGKKCDHVYDNACDTTCNECGEERAITHTPNDDDGDCTTEITCSICGTITTPAKDSHTGGIATCTEKAECTECGTPYGTVDGNNHIDENTDHICDRKCGKTDIGTHADSAEDNDHVCDYGCGEILNNHEGGTATCVSGKLCEICGVEYDTAKNPENHASDNYTYTYNDNETHKKIHECGYVEVDNEAHDHTNGKCVCGKKATPTYEVPTGLTAIYGQTLADVELPEGFDWQDATTTEVGYVGTRTFKATYTPTDTDNYEVVKDIEITITVVRDPKTEEFEGEEVIIPEE